MIKKGDFIEMDFVAKVNSTGIVFDTSIESEAKAHNIYSKETVFKPLVVCVGEGYLLKGLDDFVIDKKPGKYSVNLENAFGKKNAKLLRLVAIREFHKNKINPQPGLEVELDDRRGIVRTVNGGRVIVDFNHPLSSQDIIYDIDIKRIVEDEAEKVKSVLTFLKIPFKNVEIDSSNSDNVKVIISYGVDVPKELNEPITREIKRLTKIQECEFKQ